MLEKERLQLVAIGPRNAVQHLAMGLAAVAAGAHIFMEKPITPTLAAEKKRAHTGHWGIEFIGTKGTARILANISPQVFALKTTGWKPDGKADEWRRHPDDPTLNVPAAAQGFTQANARLVDDWLEAILSNRPPE